MRRDLPGAALADLDQRILSSLDNAWRTAGQVQRLLGYGRILEVAKSLERLWRAGLVEGYAEAIDIGVRRKRGGEEFRLQFYRQKSSKHSDRTERKETKL
jgi:hypothetical protein